MKQYRVCVVGATGAVGRMFLDILAQRDFPISELVAFASDRSVGRTVPFGEHALTVQSLTSDTIKDFDFAFFSAGSSVSRAYAQAFVDKGALVIDNSSAFRSDEGIPLIVPEVNAEVIASHKGIIANPNCSTIQMLVALKPIHDLSPIQRVIVTTFQSVSGAGALAVDETRQESLAVLKKNDFTRSIFPRPMAFNVLPQIPQSDAFLDNGYTHEEMKMLNETKKIMKDPNIRVNATCVRVPVLNGHSESITIETRRKISVEEVARAFASSPGIVYSASADSYPTAAELSGRDEVFIGRLRDDISSDRGLSMWVVSDNIRKGAALNAIQIAEHVIRGGIV